MNVLVLVLAALAYVLVGVVVTALVVDVDGDDSDSIADASSFVVFWPFFALVVLLSGLGRLVLRLRRYIVGGRER